MKLIVEKIYENAKLPSKEHARSSGFDLYTFCVHKVYTNQYLTSSMASDRYKTSLFDITENGHCVCFPHPYTADLALEPLERAMIGTGIRAKIDYDKTPMLNFCVSNDLTWELQVRPRSGTALKRGLTILNTPGTVDDGYTGELCLIVANMSPFSQIIEMNERLAQLVPAMVSLPKIEEGVVNSTDSRGEGGFNSTGTK